MSRRGISRKPGYLPGWPPWPAAALALVLLVPLVTLFVGDHSSHDDFIARSPAVASGPAGGPTFAWSALAASLAVSAAAACLAVVVGGLVAAVLEFTDVPGRSLWATLMLFAFAAPSAVWALAQVYCYGPSGLIDRWLGAGWRPWMARFDAGHYIPTALVLGQIHAPLAMLLVGRALARMPQAGWDAARLLLPPVRRWRWLAGAVRPELAASGVLAFALSLGNFAVPHVMQCRLFPIEVYLRLTNYLDSEGASRSALVLLSATLCAIVVMALIERSRPYVAIGTQNAATRIELSSGVWLVVAALAGYHLITVVLPVAAIVVECRSLTHFLAAARDAAPETSNTLRAASVAA